MAALTQDRNTPARDGDRVSLPVAAATRIYAGAMVCLDASGNAVPGATAVGLRPVGRAAAAVDNRDGTAGAAVVTVDAGVFRWANAGGASAVGTGDLGRTCYLVDDQTVARDDGAGSRSPAGAVVAVDAAGVWVRIGLGGGGAPAWDFAQRTVTLTGISSPLATNLTASDSFTVAGVAASDLVVGERYAGTQDGAVHTAAVTAADEVTVRTVNAAGITLAFATAPVATLTIARRV